MTNTRWRLSTGVELPEPDVPIYLPEALVGSEGLPALEFRQERPPEDIAQQAVDTYRWAHNNAVALLEEAQMLSTNGRHARAFALACSALEEIGKSQYAADVSTGFIPHDDFEKTIRNHQFKSAYPSRLVELGPLIQPLLKDKRTAEAIFQRRNDALYASPTNEAADVDFEQDAATMIDYCRTWLERIRSQEEISERIGTKAFLK